MQYYSYSQPAWANADKTAITANVAITIESQSTPYTCRLSDPVSRNLFEAIVADKNIVIAPYVARIATPEDARGQIIILYSQMIIATLKGKDASLLREAAYLSSQQAQNIAMTAEQSTELVMFAAINNWESQMIERRNALIAAGDVASARQSNAWPAPPVGLDDFLDGF